MSDFRKQMHLAYKKKLAGIILQFLGDLEKKTDEFSIDPIIYVAKWVDSNCLPMGDFNKEEIIKEIEEWSK